MWEKKTAHEGKKTENPVKNGIRPILTLPGVSSQMVKGDCLHILFSHGVLSHFLGSVLHTMVYYEGPGKRSAVPPADRLGKIFTHVQKHYSEQGCKSRMTNLKLSMITDQKNPMPHELLWIQKVLSASIWLLHCCQWSRKPLKKVQSHMRSKLWRPWKQSLS